MKNDTNTTIKELKDVFQEFVDERKWQKYHHPKDLAEAICIEAAELLEVFQWRKPQEFKKWLKNSSSYQHAEEELADIIMYCLSLSNVMNLDITKAVMKKLKKDRKKYPIEKFKGKAHLE